ncbi:MAG: beta-propeller fold lactonase family protein [Bacteroidota bacterium]
MVFPRLARAVLLALLLVGLGLFTSPAEATADTPPRLYVSNQGEATVSVINMETNTVETVIDLKELGFSENASPHHTIAEPDGSAWYVSLISENTVLKFNADNELVSQGTMEAPGLLALHPDGEHLFAARSMKAVNPPQRIGMMPRNDLQALEEVDVFFDRPHALVIPDDGSFVYVGSLATNQLIGLNADTQRGEVTPLDGPTHVMVQMAASPTSATVVGTGQVTGQLLFFTREDNGALAPDTSLQVGSQPWHPVYSPDGERIYVPNKESNTISVVDAEARTVAETIEHPSLTQPHGTALSPDGRYLYVSNNHRQMDMEMDDMEGNMEEDMEDEMEQDNREHEEMDHGDHEGNHEHEENHDHEAMHDTPSSEADTADVPSGNNGTISVIDTETLEVVDVIEVGEYPTGIGTRVRP